VVQTARKVSKIVRRFRKKQAKRGKLSMIVGTYVVDIDKDGKKDVIRVYRRRNQRGKTLLANVKFGETSFKSRERK